VISLIWVLIASTRAFERPFSIAAMIPASWSVIVRASLTNGVSRHRRAQDSHSSSNRIVVLAGSR
jgi:hypothetical protein